MALGTLNHQIVTKRQFNAEPNIEHRVIVVEGLLANINVELETLQGTPLYVPVCDVVGSRDIRGHSLMMCCAAAGRGDFEKITSSVTEQNIMYMLFYGLTLNNFCTRLPGKVFYDSITACGSSVCLCVPNFI